MEIEGIGGAGIRLDADRGTRRGGRVNDDVRKLPPVELHHGLNLVHVIVQIALDHPGVVRQGLSVDVVEDQTRDVVRLSQIERRVQVEQCSGGQAAGEFPSLRRRHLNSPPLGAAEIGMNAETG